jgi:enterochelin esterase-like enzyme
VKDGSIAPNILVMPSVGESTGNDEAAFVADQVVPFIDSKFRTIPDAAHWAVGGISRSGGAALRAVSEHPELFSVVGGHSPATGGDTPAIVDGLRANSGRIWLDVGNEDSLVSTTTLLARLLATDGTDAKL